MSHYPSLPFEQLLGQIAEPSPVPGGGSVAAMNGATAAALVHMVANASAHKKGFEELADELTEIARSATLYRGMLLELVDRDSRAYGKVADAYKMAKETDDHKEKRKAAIQEALKEATIVPLETAKACLNVLHLALGVADMGNPNMITDAAIAALNAATGVEGGLLNVRINLSSIEDPEWFARTRDELLSIQGDLSMELSPMRELIAGISPLGEALPEE